jgi:hypothetical protein
MHRKQAMDREELIKARAHAIWEQEGRPDDRAAEHWERAEREIDSEAAKEGGNEETGAALTSTAQAEADSANESGGNPETLLTDSAEGSAILHEDVTGSPQDAPLGKKAPSKKR